jgi:hypothetical protein
MVHVPRGRADGQDGGTMAECENAPQTPASANTAGEKHTFFKFLYAKSGRIVAVCDRGSGLLLAILVLGAPWQLDQKFKALWPMLGLLLFISMCIWPIYLWRGLIFLVKRYPTNLLLFMAGIVVFGALVLFSLFLHLFVLNYWWYVWLASSRGLL